MRSFTVDYKHYNFEINYACSTIYNGVYVQSYVLIFVNVVLFTVLKFVVEEFVLHVYRYCMQKKTESRKVHPEQEMTDVHSKNNDYDDDTVSTVEVKNTIQQRVEDVVGAEHDVENSEQNVESNRKDGSSTASKRVSFATKVRNMSDGSWQESIIRSNPHYDEMCVYGKPKWDFIMVQ